MSLKAYAENIRVLHVAASLGIGGTEKTMQLLASSMDRSRYSCFVFSFEDGPRRALLEAAGIKVLVGDDLFAVLCKMIPHVIHVHRAGWTDRKLMRPIVDYKNDLPPAARPVVVETNVFGRHDPSPDREAIDMHLFVSRFCLDRYCRDNGVRTPSPRHGLLYNPVDVEAFAHLGAAEDAPARNVVGRVSRPDPGKWSALAWRFVPSVAATVPDFSYRVIGMIDEAADFFSQNGLAERVETLPPVLGDGELAAFFGSIDVLAHANDTGESFGMVIAESMAAGLPVVTHRCPAPRDNAQAELVEHGQTGFVAEDEEAYASYVAQLLKDPRLARTMGLRGRDKARAEFAVPVVAQKLAAIYERLLAAGA